jgi:STE24 endopeptidase
MPAGLLRDRLLACARRLGFRCSDILLWNTRNGMANAMVIGLVPWLRYVVFTDRLIEEFSEEEVEAVFGHEAGHIRHQHMSYYLLFLTLSIAVLVLLGDCYLMPFLINSRDAVLARYWPALRTTAESGKMTEDLALFPMVALTVGYIFLVFGFLSRRCERQADLFGCRATSCRNTDCLGHDETTSYPLLGGGLCTTGIRTFIRALEKVAHVNAISRDRPGFLQSWQHSTIANRVAFLQSVLVDPRIEAAFQRRLTRLKWGLLLGLVVVFALLMRSRWLAEAAERNNNLDQPFLGLHQDSHNRSSVQAPPEIVRRAHQPDEGADRPQARAQPFAPGGGRRVGE